MNLPLSGIAGALVFWFLRMKSPTGRWQDKIGKIDWVCVFPSFSSSRPFLFLASLASHLSSSLARM